MKFTKNAFLHPILFALIPILILLAQNIAETRTTDSLRALFVSLLGAITLLLILRRILHDDLRASFLTTLILILFFTYGHFYNLAGDMSNFGLDLDRHRYLIPIWLGMLLLGYWWSARGSYDRTRLHQTLNIIALISISLSVFQIGSYEIREVVAARQSEAAPKPAPNLRLAGESEQRLPDIYYLIFDEYARADSLLDDYGYDNQVFLDSLEERGFFIADCSQSNYSWTRLSLASTLNLNYLDALGVGLDPQSRDLSSFLNLISHSFVRNYFEDLGYKTVSFPTQFYWTKWKDADYYITPNQNEWERITSFGLTNAFEALLLETSAGLIVTDALQTMPNFLNDDIAYSANRLR